ncbi:unnamed protein product [Amoebophrya sp. A25]|nr:unnamed protein product [Amoebophrya sp. A25]|eukprot:GSA25T00027287001.1
MLIQPPMFGVCVSSSTSSTTTEKDEVQQEVDEEEVEEPRLVHESELNCTFHYSDSVTDYRLRYVLLCSGLYMDEVLLCYDDVTRELVRAANELAEQKETRRVAAHNEKVGRLQELAAAIKNKKLAAGDEDEQEQEETKTKSTSTTKQIEEHEQLLEQLQNEQDEVYWKPTGAWLWNKKMERLSTRSLADLPDRDLHFLDDDKFQSLCSFAFVGEDLMDLLADAVEEV